MNTTFPLRTEVWHPLSIHFPVSLLVIATFMGVISLFLNPERKLLWQKTGTITLIIGTLGAWVSIYTGNLADGIVARKLCDPTILKEHEIAGFTLTYLFTGATLFHLFMLRLAQRHTLKNILHYTAVILMSVGMVYLFYTAHLGAALVYEQGAAVNMPTADCAGFE